MTDILFSTRPDQLETWVPELERWSRELNIPFALHTDPEKAPLPKLDMLVHNPVDGVQDLAPFKGVKVIQSIWAGVERFLSNPTLPEGPTLCRMVEPGLTEGMTDYITGHVMRHHLNIDRNIHESSAAIWNPVVPPLSSDRKVGVLGLGALGADAARMLARLRFDVAGWSRSARSLDGVTCFHGDEGLTEILQRSEILVTILPSTAETRGLMNAKTLALLPKGAVIINPGRGQLIEEAALLDAVNGGHIAHATLDVFNTEPLPQGHPFWSHPKITITPHIAAETRASGAARVVVEQIGRITRGEPLQHIVDPAIGY